MSTPSLTIRDPESADLKGWRPLWDAYIAFYEASVPEAVTALTWARILDPIGPVRGRLALREGRVVGFSHSILHANTWVAGPVCYLEDLFVDPAERGGGVGQALIQDLVDTGKREGWATLYWVTRAGNATARRLYDRFVPADDFVRYRIALG